MLEFITQFFAYLLTVSVAAERCTEIFKLTFIKNSSVMPKFNGGIYQMVSGMFGMAIVYASPPDMSTLHINKHVLVLIIGLAVSGGSGAWNSVLDYLRKTADSKTSETTVKK